MGGIDILIVLSIAAVPSTLVIRISSLNRGLNKSAILDIRVATPRELAW